MRTARKQNRVSGTDIELENEELRAQLNEAQETLRAIRAGEVDAVIAATPQGDRVFTLRGAETPYRVIVENISEGAATLLADGTILYANGTFSNILDTPLERIVGTRFEDYVWEPDRTHLPELFQEGLKRVARGEITLVHGSEVLPVYISLRKLPLDDDRIGFAMIITDISERKSAEKELRKAHNELGLRVQDRTRELKEANKALQEEIVERKRAEEGLKQAVEELERSNSELQQFAYVASHDLQEPLRTVASYVDLLAMRYRGKLDEKADKYIAFAVEGASRMAALINDLLAYSRLGTRVTSFTQVNMNEVFHAAAGNLKRAALESQAIITSDDLPVVAGDEAHLIRLLQNLVANSIKFRKKDIPPRVHISIERGNKEWVFGVHDNGIGISDEFRERIFVIFQRLHTKDEYPGTGVGLAICRRIVERHGGRIWVASKQGEGSTFYFTLPMA